MRATDKIVKLESQIAKLEIENKDLKLKIEEMETVEQLDCIVEKWLERLKSVNCPLQTLNANTNAKMAISQLHRGV